MEQKKKLSAGAMVAFVIAAVLLVEILPAVLSGMISSKLGYGDGEERQEQTYQKISYTELTKQQRLEDFDYFFEMIRTSLPFVHDMRDKYGFSVLDKEEQYRNACAACEDDYSFIALMSSIANDIPSGHAAFAPPDYYSYFTSGYYRCDTVGINLADNLRGKLDAYAEYLVDKQSEYNSRLDTGIYFSYVDGTYLCTSGNSTEYHSTLVSINGNDPEEFVSEMISPTGKIQYNPKHDRAYRSSLLFSSTGTEPVTLELELYDGTVCEAQYYSDYDLCYALHWSRYYTKSVLDSITDDGELFETAPDAGEDAAKVFTDPVYDLAYVSVSSLNYSDGSAVKKKLAEYSGYENIVIDLRGNGGGLSDFFEEYIYPALYKDDARFEATGYVPKNSYTSGLFDGFFGGLLNRMVNNLRFGNTDDYPGEMYDCNGGEYYKYTFSHELTGDSTLSYSDSRNIYYIVNDYTCSAADEIVQMVKQCNLGTVVGTNTMGEGLVFGVCCDWLPNSLLMYYFCPTYAIDSEGVNNNLYGTQPDIYGGTTVEGYIVSDLMELMGEDWTTLSAREQWDNNYRIILSDIGALDAAA